MSVVFSSYVPGTSPLHRLDPRIKLWTTILALAVTFILPDLPLQVLILGAVHLLLRLSGIPWHRLLRVWRQMAILMLLIVLLQPLLAPEGRTIAALGPVRFTVGGIQEGLRFALRALNIAFIISGLLFTTEHRVLVLAMVRLGLPYTWGLTISLALRFLPAIHSLFRSVHDAQAARGWVARGNPLRRLQHYLPVLVAVMIGTLRMSDDLTLALAARGLSAESERTVWRDLSMQRSDWLWLALVTLAFGVIIWSRSSFSFGGL